MTPWVLRLLIANVAVFFLVAAQPMLGRLLAFVPAEIHLRPWTAVTYMFVHAGFMHLLFNMIGLFFFGPRLEQRLGSRSFLILYFLSGLGGALFSFVFEPAAAVVGASGAVFGILFGFAYFWPRENIYIWGVLPIQARWLAAMLVAVSLYSGISGSQSGIAHFAHLGGIALGYGYLRWQKWRRERRRRKRTEAFRSAAGDSTASRKQPSVERWKSIPVETLHELNRVEVEELLQRVEADGPDSLSSDERDFLNRMVETSSG